MLRDTTRVREDFNPGASDIEHTKHSSQTMHPSPTQILSFISFARKPRQGTFDPVMNKPILELLLHETTTDGAKLRSYLGIQSSC